MLFPSDETSFFAGQVITPVADSFGFPVKPSFRFRNAYMYLSIGFRHSFRKHMYVCKIFVSLTMKSADTGGRAV